MEKKRPIVTGKILLYHSVSEDRDFPASSRVNVLPAAFRGQVEYLKAHFTLVDLSAALSASPKEAERLVSVTFDDGYEDNFASAYPILRERGVPVTFFLTAGQVGRDWDFPRGRYPGLRWEEAGEMGRDPLVGFGSHGLRHIALDRMEPDEAAREAVASKAILEEKLGRVVDHYSYPHGVFLAEVKEAVRKAGYRAAFSVVSGNEDAYSLRRILISRSDNTFRFTLKLSPLYWPLRKVLASVGP